MKKLFMSFMAMLLSGVMCMPVVFADTVKLGTVSDATKEDILHKGAEKPKADVKGANTSNVTVTYKGINAKTLREDGTRPDGYAWLGVKVDPDSEYQDSLDKVNVRITYLDYNVNDHFYYTTKTGTYNGTVDADNTYYLGIDNMMLSGAMEVDTYGDGMLRFVLEFDWDGDNKYDQTVTVLVNPADVTLYNYEDEYTVWDIEAYQAVLDSLIEIDEESTEPSTNVSTNNTSNVNKKASLDDVPKTGVVYSVINYLA